MHAGPHRWTRLEQTISDDTSSLAHQTTGLEIRPLAVTRTIVNTGFPTMTSCAGHFAMSCSIVLKH